MDLVEAGNIVRWPVGLRAVGHTKTAVIGGTITGDYPFTSIDAREHQIGRAALEEEVGEPEMETLERFVEGADLLIDVTAEIGIGQLLSLSRTASTSPSSTSRRRRAHSAASSPASSPDGRGAGSAYASTTSAARSPIPPREETGTVQPRGCATPTFTGANFDLLPIVAQAARMAAEILIDPDPDAAGDDVAVMAFNEDGRRLTAPRWSTFPLSRDLQCPLCGGDGS